MFSPRPPLRSIMAAGGAGAIWTVRPIPTDESLCPTDPNNVSKISKMITFRWLPNAQILFRVFPNVYFQFHYVHDPAVPHHHNLSRVTVLFAYMKCFFFKVIHFVLPIPKKSPRYREHFEIDDPVQPNKLIHTNSDPSGR